MEVKSNASYTDATNKENNLGFSNNTKLIDRKDIEKTPFKRIRTEEGEFFTIGQKAITGKLTHDEANEIEAELRAENWELMMRILSVMVTETVATLHLDIMKWNEKMEREGGLDHE